MKAKYPEYKGLNLPNIAAAVLEKWQKEAIEMEPHSQQMRRQLALFEAEKAKQAGK